MTVGSCNNQDHAKEGWFEFRTLFLINGWAPGGWDSGVTVACVLEVQFPMLGNILLYTSNKIPFIL